MDKYYPRITYRQFVKLIKYKLALEESIDSNNVQYVKVRIDKTNTNAWFVVEEFQTSED